MGALILVSCGSRTSALQWLLSCYFLLGVDKRVKTRGPKPFLPHGPFLCQRIFSVLGDVADKHDEMTSPKCILSVARPSANWPGRGPVVGGRWSKPQQNTK